MFLLVPLLPVPGHTAKIFLSVPLLLEKAERYFVVGSYIFLRLQASTFLWSHRNANIPDSAQK